MATTQPIDDLVKREYKHGFITDIESDTLPPGLNEDVVRAIDRSSRETLRKNIVVSNIG